MIYYKHQKIRRFKKCVILGITAIETANVEVTEAVKTITIDVAVAAIAAGAAARNAVQITMDAMTTETAFSVKATQWVIATVMYLGSEMALSLVKIMVYCQLNQVTIVRLMPAQDADVAVEVQLPTMAVAADYLSK